MKNLLDVLLGVVAIGIAVDLFGMSAGFRIASAGEFWLAAGALALIIVHLLGRLEGPASRRP